MDARGMRKEREAGASPREVLACTSGTVALGGTVGPVRAALRARRDHASQFGRTHFGPVCIRSKLNSNESKLNSNESRSYQLLYKGQEVP